MLLSASAGSAARAAETRLLSPSSVTATAFSVGSLTTCSRLRTSRIPSTLRATVSALAFSAAVGTLPYSVTSPSIVSTCTLATETPSVVRSAVFTFVVTHASGIESARAARGHC